MNKKYLVVILTILIVVLISNSISAKFTIILNFDDGYLGIYQNAFPLLKKNNIPGVVFMPTAFINKEGHLTLSQLKELKKAGWEIGSHTIHHSNLANLTLDGIKHEIIDSKLYLEKNDLIDSSYASFCSPMTVWNEEIEAIVASNYQVARGKKFFIFSKDIQPEVLIKVIVKDTKLITITRWIDEAYKLDQPLILVFHEIAEPGNEYYYPPEKFEKLIEKIKNYEFITFQQLINQN